MDLMWLSLSYIGSLATNIIAMCGVLSLIYWIGEVKQGWVRKWHDQIQVVIGWVFMGYLFLMSAVDGHTAPAFFGEHWSFLNVIIIASFILSLMMISWVNFGFFALGIFGYALYMPGAFTSARFMYAVVMVLTCALLTGRGRKLWDKRLLMYPLMLVYGAMGLRMMRDGVPPQDKLFWLRQIFALVLQFAIAYEYTGMLVRMRRASDRFRTEAIRDRMTGLKNFGAFNVDLGRLYRKFKNGGANFWLLELDIDHFKHINDTYGHLVGNNVLEAVARETRAYSDTLPYETTVYRMGGEEFCLLIRGGTDEVAKAREIALGLRARLTALQFVAEGKDFAITVSIGAEHMLADDKHYLDIYNRVDQYLYDAKHSGRDAVNVRGVTVR